MSNTKKSLLASGLSLLVCFALLLGTTFAWFTDSVTNSGNQITAGTLGITATAYDLDKSNTSGQSYQFDGINNGQPFYFEQDGQNLDDGAAPIINNTNWEPGQSNAKLVTVTNSGDLATKIKLEFDVTDGGLMNALWFDFIQVDQNGVTGQFVRRPMSELTTLADQTEVSVDAGQSVSFILVYGMNETAGNEYQNKTFSANVTILATQDTVEQDGFGNSDYDENATFEQIDVPADESDAAANGQKLRRAIDTAGDNALITLEEGTYELEDALVFTKPVQIVGNGDVVLDFSDAQAPQEGGYCTSAALLILSSNVSFDGVTIYGASGLNSVVTVGLDNVANVADGTITVSDDLTYDFDWAVNEFAPEYQGIYENVNFTNCTFGLETPGSVAHGLFLNCRYTTIQNCTFENIQASSAVVKIEEDHTRVIGSNFENCTGTQYAEDWCGENDQGDGNEYPGHPFKCEEGWNSLTGDAYQQHVAYAESMGYTHSSILN